MALSDRGEIRVLTLPLTEAQRDKVRELTGVSLDALKVSAALDFAWAVESRQVWRVKACDEAAVDLESP